MAQTASVQQHFPIEKEAIMNNIINLDITPTRINVQALKTSNARRISPNLIAPAREDVTSDIAIDRAAGPIKSMDDIEAFSRFYLERGRYRDNMLFIVGINFGLRYSDLCALRFSDIINEDFTFKDTFAVFEKKTRNTRKRKKNRYITINGAVVDAVTLYLEHTDNVCMSDYMFRSVSGHGKNINAPLTLMSVERILKDAAKHVGLTTNISSHTLRKTFAYWTMVMGGNDQRRLMLLQKMFNHSSPAQTIAYIGLDKEEIEEAYMSLNLGGGSTRRNYLIGSNIIERDEGVA